MHRPEEIFSISGPKEFDRLCLQTFRYQYQNNEVYREFCNYLHRDPSQVQELEQIPFLPVEFFKSREVVSGNFTPDLVFTSSGTTGQSKSRHLVRDQRLYEESFRKGFEFFYGDIRQYTILALLPSHLERSGSSLIYMVRDLISQSMDPLSGFYLHDHKNLLEKLKELQDNQKKILLIGVSYALLDLAQECYFPLTNAIVMETGGMKGRRKEMVREELHRLLKTGLGCENIHSEYGMTELLSQAYARKKGIFQCPPWMKILIRDPEDALTYAPLNASGGINVIDLANIYSCSFLATQDLGRQEHPEKTQILGRFDNSDIRGCNLLIF